MASSPLSYPRVLSPPSLPPSLPSPCFLPSGSSSSAPTPLSHMFICSILFIDLFQIVLDRLAEMIRPTHHFNWTESHYGPTSHTLNDEHPRYQSAPSRPESTRSPRLRSRETIKIPRMSVWFSLDILRIHWALLFFSFTSLWATQTFFHFWTTMLKKREKTSICLNGFSGFTCTCTFSLTWMRGLIPF